MFNLIKDKFEFLLILPIVVNFFFNLVQNDISFELNLLDIASSLLIFVFLYLIGLSIKHLINDITITFGIILYLISFFIIESILLFINQNINLHQSFLITNILWTILFLVKLKNKKFYFYTLLSYFVVNFFNNIFKDSLTSNININGDVFDIFLPNTKLIYDYSLYQSVVYPEMMGYPVFMSYIDGLIFKSSFNFQNYEFFVSTSFIFFWLFLLMFLELNINNRSKTIVVVLFSTLILNSSWLRFLFTTSLMSERVASYLFIGVLVCLYQQQKLSSYSNYIVLFIFGFLYYTKQFFSILVLILFLLHLFNKSYRKSSFILLLGFLFKQLTHLTYFKEIPQDHHIKQIDVIDTIIDLLLLRDLKIENIVLIFRNLVIDLPVTYFLFIFVLVTITNFLIYKYNTFEMRIYSVLSLLNLIFIFCLYVSVWRDMELESPIRYIYSFIPIYCVMFIISVKNIKENFYKLTN